MKNIYVFFIFLLFGDWEYCVVVDFASVAFFKRQCAKKWKWRNKLDRVRKKQNNLKKLEKGKNII